ncbi:hypothetical protein HanIR_Chr10g0494221 [Helianthus annuus]|nr:hypothetical protein HanIR_Chr10g0494221 [Helianthus annuus]
MTKCRTLQSQSSTSSTSSFRLSDKHHPTAPMVYAMISDPDVVDNPIFPELPAACVRSM